MSSSYHHSEVRTKARSSSSLPGRTSLHHDFGRHGNIAKWPQTNTNSVAREDDVISWNGTFHSSRSYCSGAFSPSRIHGLLSPAERDQQAQEGNSGSSRTENHIYGNARKEYANTRLRMLEARQRWRAAAVEVHTHLQTRLQDHNMDDPLERAWVEIEFIESQLVQLEYYLADIERENSSFHPTQPEDSPAKTVDLIPNLRFRNGSNEARSKLPKIVDLYYEHASAVRHLSDELFNLGPRPSDTPESIIDANKSDLTTHYTDGMTHQEYAKRHIELVTKLEFETQETTRYQRLCEEQGFSIDLDDDDESSSQDDDRYGSLLDDLQYGIPRIDSRLIVGASQQMVSSETDLWASRQDLDAKVARWARTVAEQTPTAAAAVTSRACANANSLNLAPSVTEAKPFSQTLKRTNSTSALLNRHVVRTTSAPRGSRSDSIGCITYQRRTSAKKPTYGK